MFTLYLRVMLLEYHVNFTSHDKRTKNRTQKVVNKGIFSVKKKQLDYEPKFCMINSQRGAAELIIGH